jgi:hypothetical protein
MMGQQQYCSADRTVEQASAPSNPYELPETLHHAIMVQIFRNRVHSTMGDVDRLEGSASQSRRGSLVKILEFELEELERRLGQSRSRR